MRTALTLFLGMTLLGLSACSSLREIDRSYVNQPAMDLKNGFTPSRVPVLVSLGDIQKGSGGGTCAACAH